MEANVDKCTLDYIPERLKQGSKQPIHVFYLFEKLYKRWPNPRPDSHPYSDVSLTDLSHNRQGSIENILSLPSDVLFNIDPSVGIEKHQMSFIPIEIKELTDEQKYYKRIVDRKKVDVYVEITLEHTPLPCNYSHCEFVFHFKGVRVSFHNYDQTIKSTQAKEVRKECRNEFSKMVVREELRMTDVR